MNESLGEESPRRLVSQALRAALRQTNADLAGFLSLDDDPSSRSCCPKTPPSIGNSADNSPSEACARAGASGSRRTARRGPGEREPGQLPGRRLRAPERPPLRRRGERPLRGSFRRRQSTRRTGRSANTRCAFVRCSPAASPAPCKPCASASSRRTTRACAFTRSAPAKRCWATAPPSGCCASRLLGSPPALARS